MFTACGFTGDSAKISSRLKRNSRGSNAELIFIKEEANKERIKRMEGNSVPSSHFFGKSKFLV